MLNNREIIEKIKEIYGYSSTAELGREIEVSKQSMSQYLKKTGLDVNSKIISKLLADLEDCRRQNSVEDKK